MPRIRSLASALFIIAVPSLFIYFFYYDSLSEQVSPTRLQPSPVIASGNSSSTDDVISIVRDSHKYAGVGRNNATGGSDGQLPRIVPQPIASEEESRDPDPEIEKRRQLVKRMMQEAWDNYVRYAWGENELQPLTRNGKQDSIFGPAKIGATIVDSMDTLLLMNMTEEFERVSSFSVRQTSRFDLDSASMDNDWKCFRVQI